MELGKTVTDIIGQGGGKLDALNKEMKDALDLYMKEKKLEDLNLIII